MKALSPVAAFVLFAIVLASAPGVRAGSQAPGATSGFAVSGEVVDLTGQAVAGARVTATRGRREVASVTTGGDGRFAFDLPPGVFDVTATAHTMAPATIRVSLPPAHGAVDHRQLVLGAATFSASITVAATALDPGTEGSSSVMTAESIGVLPSRALDDVLSGLPGFGLFRRASSRTANPTAQGVSLRGLGASGASRALVTADGYPANDPFGGWVYWSRLPIVAIDRVEVARGGRSERHGADALGGIVGIITSQASRPIEGRFVGQAGSRGTGRLSGFAGVQRGAWSAVVSAEAGRAGRAAIVRAGDRGAVDTTAGSDHAAGLFSVSWAPSPALTGSLRLNPFGERRDNGTALQENDTRAGQAAAVAAGATRGGQWEVRGWGQWTVFRQTFSIVSPDRDSERPGNKQRVTSTAAGVRARWDHVVGPAAFGAGLELRNVEADNLEGPATTPSAARSVGGVQSGPAVFARASTRIGSRLRADAGARWESWSNTPSPAPSVSRRESAFSPRITLTWAPGQAVVAHGAVYGAFRAPTLNELYRGFRVGAIVTQPNENLAPERLTGAEAGVGWTRRGVALRATGWWSRLDGPVSNVTIAPSERQRQNVGAIDGRGLEAELVLRPSAAIESVTSLALTRSIFDDPIRPAIDGRDVPQVAGVQWSSRLRYARGPVSAALEIRRAGRQFEDDRNELVLRPSWTLDLAAGYRVARRVEILLSIENAADADVEVGRTPVPTIGLPRTIAVGVRFDTR